MPKISKRVKVLDVNPATLELFGAQNKAELLGSLDKVLVPESIPDVKRVILAIAEKRPAFIAEVVNRTLDGKKLHLSLALSIPGEKDPFNNMLVSMSDITDRVTAERQRQNLEQQLIQAHKLEALGTLAGGIAHDFNNILSAILGYTELCLADAEPQSPLQHNLSSVHRATLRAAELVKQILTFSRQKEDRKGPVQMGPIVTEALTMLRSSLPTSIEIRQDIVADAGHVQADPTQIHQILMNLGTNAAHAMENEGGILRVRLARVELDAAALALPADLYPGPYLKLTVSDTGCGMSPEMLSSIFDPYFSTKEVGKGTGLGLAVVHGIVKHAGGAVQVESEPGRGSTFTVYLPAVESSAPEVQVKDPALTGGTERILLVDDETALAELGRKQLTRLGYRVQATTDSREALAWFKQAPQTFDLVITDMTMPHMNGDKLAAEMLKINPGLPIILCTGYSHMISQKRALEEGIRAFVVKPIQLSELAQTIRSVLR